MAGYEENMRQKIAKNPFARRACNLYYTPVGKRTLFVPFG
jgi:hypothetical protein